MRASLSVHACKEHVKQLLNYSKETINSDLGVIGTRL